jgi:hypothetical protein
MAVGNSPPFAFHRQPSKSPRAKPTYSAIRSSVGFGGRFDLESKLVHQATHMGQMSFAGGLAPGPAGNAQDAQGVFAP